MLVFVNVHGCRLPQSQQTTSKPFGCNLFRCYKTPCLFRRPRPLTTSCPNGRPPLTSTLVGGGGGVSPDPASTPSPPSVGGRTPPPALPIEPWVKPFHARGAGPGGAGADPPAVHASGVDPGRRRCGRHVQPTPLRPSSPKNSDPRVSGLSQRKRFFSLGGGRKEEGRSRYETRQWGAPKLSDTPTPLNAVARGQRRIVVLIQCSSLCVTLRVPSNAF